MGNLTDRKKGEVRVTSNESMEAKRGYDSIKTMSTLLSAEVDIHAVL